MVQISDILFEVFKSSDLSMLAPDMTDQENWEKTFEEIYRKGIARYENGNRQARDFFSADERDFLTSIGCTEQELFDFVEDNCNHGEPSFEAALAIQAERRDYLQSVQNNKSSENIQPVESFPSKADELEGIAWLPRIIAKVRAKLRGELPPDLMYG